MDWDGNGVRYHTGPSAAFGRPHLNRNLNSP